MHYDFSDGAPHYEVAVAASLVAAFALLTPWPRLAAALDRAAFRFASALRRAGLVTSDDVGAELRRIDLLRIALALFLLGRFWSDFSDALHVGASSTAAWTGLGCALSLGLAAGIATPAIAGATALLVNLIIDNYTLNVSLGSIVAASCLIPMFIAPAGHTLSLDSLLLDRKDRLGAAMRAIYGLWGEPNLQRIHISRFLAFMAYASINLYSVMKHLDAPTWLAGATTGMILISPVTNPRWSYVAKWLYEHQTVLYASLTLISTYGMMFWQLFMLPLALLSRWTRLFVIVWGLAFFAFSTYVLHLKRLGVYEFILWALVFWDGWKVGWSSRKSFSIYFDGRSALWSRVFAVLRVLDVFRAVRFVSVSETDAEAGTHGPADVDTSEIPVGVTAGGRTIRGFELFVQASREALLLVPLSPLLRLVDAVGLGAKIYGWAAARSQRAAGRTSSGRRAAAAWDRPALPKNNALFRGTAIAFVVLFAGFCVRLPPVQEQAPRIAAFSREVLGQSPLVFGMGPINVFNENDLQIYRRLAATGYVSPDGKTSPAYLDIGETVGSALTARLRFIALEPLFCDRTYAELVFSALNDSLPAEHAYRKGEAFIQFQMWTRPANADFAKFRHVPETWSAICTISAKLDQPKRTRISYHAAALEKVSAVALGFEPSLRRLELASRFPCRLERPVAALWYDRPGRFSRTPADYDALVRLFRMEQVGAIECLGAYKSLTEGLAAKETSDALRPTAGTCESELQIAETYVSDVLDDELRIAAAPSLAEARRALEAGDTETCRSAAADVRRQFFSAIYGGQRNASMR